MKKLIYVVSLAVASVVLDSCYAGYVASEPAYVEYSRPSPPSNSHVWIDGGWGWNHQTNVYVQKSGYWDRPRQGQSYVSGHWQTTPHGKSWSNGHWQKNRRR
jgi:hypothetical protein